jgi:hypothetical protein
MGVATKKHVEFRKSRPEVVAKKMSAWDRRECLLR